MDKRILEMCREKDAATELLRDVCDDVVGYLNTLSAESAYTPVLIEKLHRIDTYLKERG